MQVVIGMPCTSRATIFHCEPSGSMVMNPNALVDARCATTAPGAGVADAGNGFGNRGWTQSPLLPETNCAGCGVAKLTTSNRCT